MPAIANVVLNDGLATPVARTFSVQNTTGTIARWVERSAGVLAGFIGLTDEVRMPATPQAAWRRLIGFNLPTVATVNGVVTVARTSSAQVIFNFSQQSTEQERRDLVAYVVNYVNDAGRRTAIINNEPFF